MKLTIRKKILMGLGILADEVFDWIDLIEMTPRQYLRKSSKEKHYFRKVAKELCKFGDVEKKIIKGRAVYRFTSRGWDKLALTFPVFKFMGGKWDGLWTIVSYDIPEENRKTRNKLRRKLKELTFGQYQRSIWITPHPVDREIKEFIEGNNLSSFVHAYRTKQISGNPKEIALNAWKLYELDKRYDKFIKKWTQKLIEKDVKEFKEKFFDDMSKEYGEILLLDPGLPKDLLPKNWQGGKARNLVRYFYKV